MKYLCSERYVVFSKRDPAEAKPYYSNAILTYLTHHDINKD